MLRTVARHVIHHHKERRKGMLHSLIRTGITRIAVLSGNDGAARAGLHLIGSVFVAVLFRGFGSLNPAGGVNVTVTVTLVPAVPVTFAQSVQNR